MIFGPCCRVRVSSFLVAIVFGFPLAASAQFEVRELSLVVNELVANSATGEIHASTPGTVATDPNSVITIDPATGDVSGAIFVGSSPRTMAVSDDGDTLYVSLDGAFSVRRVDLASGVAGISFSLGSHPFFGPFGTEDIEVTPGNPDQIAVALTRPSVSPRHGGVAVFDDGVQLPLVTQEHTGSNRIEFTDDPSRVIGYNNETTEFGVRHIDIGPGGATQGMVARGVISGFGVDIEYHSGRIYATSGVVVDPNSLNAVGTYPLSRSARGVVADSGAGLVFFLTEAGIEIFDLDNFTFVETVPIPGLSFPARPSHLVQWGPGRLAFRTESSVFLVDTSPPDEDGDGVTDGIDNCLGLPNPGQDDADEDGLGDPCDPFPDRADHDLAVCEADVASVAMALDQCLATPAFLDADGDGEHDDTDPCPETAPGDAVDDAGCSHSQFCSALFEPAVCRSSDWRNDEPLDNPGDCRWSGGRRGTAVCAPRYRSGPRGMGRR
jgi:hypothetical protein